MYFASTFVACFLLCVYSEALSIQPNSFGQTKGFRRFYSEHPNKRSLQGATVPLSRGVGVTRRVRRDANLPGSPLTAVARNLLANVTVGDQPFELLVDTGSSDTWLVALTVLQRLHLTEGCNLGWPRRTSLASMRERSLLARLLATFPPYIHNQLERPQSLV